MERKYDFLVVGSGVAGLTYALKVAEYGKVCLLSKAKLDETNTNLAQGGIAAVTYEPDSYSKHIADTLDAGAGLCNKNIVDIVVKEAPERIKELINWGTSFDKKNDGKFDLAREGGHSEHRILHHKDNTGHEIQISLTKKVLQHKNIDCLDHYFAIDLITQHHKGETVRQKTGNIDCYGIYALNLQNNSIDTILAKTCYLATGGIGNVYFVTTNPVIATGDGIAMVYRAKGLIENMEFVQFHPTSLYNPGERPSFLITEALRGFGGLLKLPDGNEFMHKYDQRASLAPRDIVARGIDSEMKLHGLDHVYLDVRHLDQKDLGNHFPNIIQKCKTIGIDVAKDMIPVVPAAHYLCGGIKVDEYGQTSINHLYSGGEAASTGLHGANRLASNSLLEAVVFAHRSAMKGIQNIKNIKFAENIPAWDDRGTSHPEEMVLITQNKKELQQIMSSYVGIVRSNLRLERALNRLQIISNETEDLYKKSTISQEICELRNAVNVSYLIIQMAAERKESIGLHYTIDYK